MKMTVPIDLTGKVSSISGTFDWAAVDDWDVAVGYELDAVVRHSGQYWVSQSANNIGNTPAEGSEYWVCPPPETFEDISAMLDSSTTSQTVGVQDTVLSLTLDVSKLDTVAILNAQDVESVAVEVFYNTSGTVVVNETFSMTRNVRDAVSSSWWEYFFGEIEYRENMVIDLGAAWVNSEVRLAIQPKSGCAPKIGVLAVGSAKRIGTAQFPVQPSLADYSTVTVDDDGISTLEPGLYAKNLTIPVRIAAANMDQAVLDLAAVRGKPAIWDANENGTEWESLTTYGFIREFSLVIPGPVYSNCSIYVEGLA